MSVLCEAISVVIPRAVLDRLYPGGTDGYAAATPNRTFCADEHLTRIGFMHPADVKQQIDHLVAVGLTPAEDDVFVDLAVIDQFEGSTLPCPWIDWERIDGLTRAWLVGTEQGALATPSGWERTPMALWRNGHAGAIEVVADPDVDVSEASFVARTFEDE